MTYQECENLIAEKWNPISTDKINYSGKPINVLGVFVAPEDSDQDLKNLIFNKVFKEGQDNKNFLLDNDLWNREKRVFIAFQMAGNNLVVPFEAFLSNSETSAS
jgi:hypothetical protein